MRSLAKDLPNVTPEDKENREAFRANVLENQKKIYKRLTWNSILLIVNLVVMTILAGVILGVPDLNFAHATYSLVNFFSGGSIHPMGELSRGQLMLLDELGFEFFFSVFSMFIFFVAIGVYLVVGKRDKEKKKKAKLDKK